jgi:hypothetical protein
MPDRNERGAGIGRFVDFGPHQACTIQLLVHQADVLVGKVVQIEPLALRGDTTDT